LAVVHLSPSLDASHTPWSYQWFRVDGARRAGDIADDFHDLVMAGLRPK
jgi:hypothetical protein